MEILTLNKKGQITIPKPIRDKFGMTSGTRIEFTEGKKGEFILKIIKPQLSSKA